MHLFLRWIALAISSCGALSVSVFGAPPTVSGGSASARVGSPFQYFISASGATSYDARPLPRGLTLDAATGRISGSPLDAGTTPVTLSARNLDGTATAMLTLTVAPGPTAPPVIANASFDTSIAWAGRDNMLGWYFRIDATNEPTSYAVSGLPNAVVIPSDPLVSLGGTSADRNVPAGIHNVTLSASNAVGMGTKAIQIRVFPSITEFRPEKRDYVVGETLRVFVTFNGPVNVAGVPTIRVNTGQARLISGSGTPQLVFSYVIQPMDFSDHLYLGMIELNGGAITHVGSGLAARLYGPPKFNGAEWDLVAIRGAPVITSLTSAAATVGSPFSYSIAAVNRPFRYAARGLPPGLSVDATSGLISGTPTTAGTFPVTLEVTSDRASDPNPGTQVLTLTVANATGPATPPLTPTGPIAQTITLTPPPTVVAGQPATITATASSGLPVTLSVVSGAGSVVGNVLTAAAPGAVVLRGSQAGSAEFNAATTTVTIQVVAAPVTPTPPPLITPPPASTPPPIVTPPPVTTPPPVAPPPLGPVTPPPVVVNPPVLLAPQSIEFLAPVSVPVMGQPFLLSATSSAGLPVTFAVVSGNATISGNALVVLGPGPVVVRASQGGSASVAPASAQVTITGAVRAGQAVTFVPPGTVLASDEPLLLTATSSAGLPVTFTLVSGPAVLSGNRLVPTGAAGDVIIRARQAGTEAVEPAEVTRTIQVVVGAGSRLANVSSRLQVSDAEPDRAFITGFVVAGSTPQRVLIRAAGPALSNFGVDTALTNPRLRLYDGSGRMLAENDDWSGTDISAASSQVGAFALGAGSRDAALISTLEPGAYTVHVLANGGAGVALAEVYDASTNAAAARPPLTNLSTRGFVGAGEAQVSVGFVISGNAPKRVLVRGVGPGLQGFGVAGALADPQLSLYRGSVVIGRNDDWQTPLEISGSGVTAASASELTDITTRVGGFALLAGGKDAALLVTLAPGAYTALVSGGNGGTGVALVEVYEAP